MATEILLVANEISALAKRLEDIEARLIDFTSLVEKIGKVDMMSEIMTANGQEVERISLELISLAGKVEATLQGVDKIEGQIKTNEATLEEMSARLDGFEIEEPEVIEVEEDDAGAVEVIIPSSTMDADRAELADQGKYNNWI